MRLPLRRLQAFLEPADTPLGIAAARQQHVIDLVNRVIEAGRPIFRTNCLTRGVTRYYFLRRLGIDVQLVFGVGRPTRGGLAGHCWLVKDGEPYLETQDPRPVFAETYRMAAAC